MIALDTNELLGRLGLAGKFLDVDPKDYAIRIGDPAKLAADASLVSAYGKNLLDLGQSFVQRFGETQMDVAEQRSATTNEIASTLTAQQNPMAITDYLVDLGQRWVMFLDILRRRGNMFIKHETEGCPPVLAYEYDVVVDGSKLARPVNYSLVRIRPPAGTPATNETHRPYIIIDPRAGHGSGIGGFKSESEVGVALRQGHPVYFCIFRTHPEPTQTIADVCRAEAEFVREVQRLHEKAPKPVIVGNCQGGWAAMLLAATNPDLTGPVVCNGSPLSYWSGVRGKSSLRYTGGLVGGVWPVLLMADLGNGQFDGANLVLNFEAMNPSNTWWHKYYDVFCKGEDEAERYLEFERWWSGFYFMNENEIRWIVDNLFIGNKLARGGVSLDAGQHVDLRNIRAPIIIFASHGDNITPPPQALNWIADIYKDVRQIKARGQKIIYTIHDTIGHLGIFVSSSVAKKQHSQITSALKTIEDLSPGLYEMKIVEVKGEGVDRTYEVDFEERSIEDVLKLDGDRDDELPLSAIARFSQFGADLYQMTLRPFIKSVVSKASAQQLVDSNPLRMRRYAMSDRNPLLTAMVPLAEAVQKNRKPISPDNPFLKMERLYADLIGDMWNVYRDVRDSMVETSIFLWYGSPILRALGTAAIDDRIADAPADNLRVVPEVRLALAQIDTGGFADAVIRMLILLAKSRGAVRQDRLARSHELLTQRLPFSVLSSQTRNHIIHTQSIIVEFERQRALETLPMLLPSVSEREHALEACLFVAGSEEEMDDDVRVMVANLRAALGVTALAPEPKAPEPKAPETKAPEPKAAAPEAMAPKPAAVKAPAAKPAAAVVAPAVAAAEVKATAPKAAAKVMKAKAAVRAEPTNGKVSAGKSNPVKH
jgi:pimeloyl-ACP methyl ester carboxylesterase